MEVLAQQIPEVVLDESLRIVKQQITHFANTAPRMPVPLLCSFPPILIVFVVLRYSLFFNGFQRFRCQIYCQFGETEMAGILSSTIRYQACWLPLFTTKLRYGFFTLLESLHCSLTASSTPSCGFFGRFGLCFLFAYVSPFLMVFNGLTVFSTVNFGWTEVASPGSLATTRPTWIRLTRTFADVGKAQCLRLNKIWPREPISHKLIRSIFFASAKVRVSLGFRDVDPSHCAYQ